MPDDNTPKTKRPASSPLENGSTPPWVDDIIIKLKSHISEELASMKTDIKVIKTDIIDLKACMNINTETIKKHEQSINLLKPLQETFIKLSIDNQRLQQRNLQNNLLISNIPKQDCENLDTLKKTFEQICTTLKVKIDMNNDVMELIRLPSKFSTDPILVKFYNMRVKLDILSSQSKESLRVGQILKNSSIEKVFFGHQLTHHYQKLLRGVRQSNTRILKYKYVWFSWRSIDVFVKKSDNDRAICISSMDDLLKLEAGSSTT